MAGGNMDPASPCDRPIPCQQFGPGIPMYLPQSFRTGPKCMLAHSFQYLILKRSYQKTKPKCIFWQSKNNRLIFLVLYKA